MVAYVEVQMCFFTRWIFLFNYIFYLNVSFITLFIRHIQLLFFLTLIPHPILILLHFRLFHSSCFHCNSFESSYSLQIIQKFTSNVIFIKAKQTSFLLFHKCEKASREKVWVSCSYDIILVQERT